MALVKILATLSIVSTWLSSIIFFSTMYLMKWYLISKWFDLLWWIGFCVNWMALLLSKYKIVASLCFSQSSSIILINHNAWALALMIEMYSTLVDERDIVLYLFEIHVIIYEPRLKHWLDLLFLLSMLLLQSESL